jgi:hypothetical protein
MHTTTIEPTAEQIGALADAPDDRPIVMLNLLRFKERADGIDAAEAITGRQAYERYGEGVAPHIARVGAEVLAMGECRQSVIAPRDEAWDGIVLVRYPSR